MVWLLVRFPDCIALEFINHCAPGLRPRNGFSKGKRRGKLRAAGALTSKIGEGRAENVAFSAVHELDEKKIGMIFAAPNDFGDFTDHVPFPSFAPPNQHL